jgi:hypothetical protein
MMPGQLSSRRRIACAALVLACGCTRVDGGAVELSWKLRPASGPASDPNNPFLDCNIGLPSTSAVSEIQLSWTPCTGPTCIARWDCTQNHGVTGFELDEGAALLTVTPVCANGPAAPAMYEPPPPIQRDVVTGNIVNLGAVELVLQVTDCDATTHPCICQP